MIVTMDEIAQNALDCFATKYPQFKDFQADERYRPYWTLCLQCVQNRDLVNNIIFCNDLFAIPPVKTFLCYHANELVSISGNATAQLDDFVKKSIGAFWGFVFKYMFEYAGQKSVSISLNKQFMVKTATYYTLPQKTLILAY